MHQEAKTTIKFPDGRIESGVVSFINGISEDSTRTFRDFWIMQKEGIKDDAEIIILGGNFVRNRDNLEKKNCICDSKVT